MAQTETADLFEKCFARIDRAVHHSNEAADIWNEFDVLSLHGISLNIESDGTGELDVRQLEPLPQTLELLIGEYLYQLRAALDGAIYACAIEDSGQDPPPKASTIEFPICESIADWPKQARKIAQLNPGRRRFIEALQPFAEPSVDASLRIANANRSLRFLNDLARIDRHRRLHTFVTAIGTDLPIFELPEGVSLKSLAVRSSSNDPGPIVRFSLEGWQDGMDLQANPNADVEISLEGMLPAAHTNDTFTNRLKSIVMNVRIVISLLQKNTWIEPINP